MRAVVTGSSGFIGRHLTAQLARRGYEVTGVDRAPLDDEALDHRLPLDLAEPPEHSGLRDALGSADIVFHLAGRPGVRGGGPRLDALRHRDNVVATDHVLSLTRSGTHVVASSSSAVYGGAKVGPQGVIPNAEAHPIRPGGGYARSKADMEALCSRFADRGGSITVVRPFTVVGENQRPDMAFAVWLESLRRGAPIRIFGSAHRSRDLTDVNDVVEGLIRCAEARVPGRINLGTGQAHRLGDMALALIRASGLRGRVVQHPAPPEEVSTTLADTRRCERLLGFVPSMDLDRVLARLVASVPPAQVAS